MRSRARGITVTQFLPAQPPQPQFGVSGKLLFFTEIGQRCMVISH